MRNLPVVSLCLMLCIGLPACSGGPKLVKVTGKLTLHQQPLPIGKGGVVLVLIPVVDEGGPASTYPAVYHRHDGSFEVPGNEGHGIPVGKYKISVQPMTMTPSEAIVKITERFKVANTPILRDIADEQPLQIELGEFLKD